MFKALMRRLRSDRGDSIMISMLVAIPVLALIAGISFDTVKSAYVRQDLTGMVQQAADTAIRSTDARGSLDWGAVSVATDEFYTQYWGILTDEPQTREAAAFEDVQCSTGMVDGVEKNLPYFKYSLDTERSGGLSSDARSVEFRQWVFFFRDPPELDQNKIYSVLDMTVYVGVPNVVGNCQILEINASATKYEDYR